MKATDTIADRAGWKRASWVARSSFAAMAIFTASTLAAHAQQSFSSAEDAAQGLINAAKSKGVRAIMSVLGSQASEIISSGDAVADADIRQKFISAYDTTHRIDQVGDGKAVLIIGKDDFPFPIPLVRKNGKWEFDTVAGKDEILFRRIGRNELNAIQTCLAYVDAQVEYSSKDQAGRGAYARQFVSDPGTNNGLYWPSKPGAEESPLGELFAKATSEGYRVRQGQNPYHGYYYKILTEQGASAPGGALDYVVNRRMIGGFALVAYPAEYRNSGVMTFIVSHAGVVFQKDLGPRTVDVARAMTEFNPDKTWAKAN